MDETKKFKEIDWGGATDKKFMLKCLVLNEAVQDVIQDLECSGCKGYVLSDAKQCKNCEKCLCYDCYKDTKEDMGQMFKCPSCSFMNKAGSGDLKINRMLAKMMSKVMFKCSRENCKMRDKMMTENEFIDH